MVRQLQNQVTDLKGLVNTLIQHANSEPKDIWMNIDEFRAFHSDHPAKPTIYEWVAQKLIPVHKDGKKLRFLRSEIEEWLNGGRQKTQAELDQEALEYVHTHKHSRK